MADFREVLAQEVYLYLTYYVHRYAADPSRIRYKKQDGTYGHVKIQADL